jgi:hypothetical protein
VSETIYMPPEQAYQAYQQAPENPYAQQPYAQQPYPYAQPQAYPDPNDGKAIQIVGYSMAGASLIIPLLGLAGLVLGIITATKPRRGGHGAAIIVLSLLLGIVGFAIWSEINASSTTTY